MDKAESYRDKLETIPETPTSKSSIPESKTQISESEDINFETLKVPVSSAEIDNIMKKAEDQILEVYKNTTIPYKQTDFNSLPPFPERKVSGTFQIGSLYDQVARVGNPRFASPELPKIDESFDEDTYLPPTIIPPTIK